MSGKKVSARSRPASGGSLGPGRDNDPPSTVERSLSEEYVRSVLKHPQTRAGRLAAIQKHILLNPLTSQSQLQQLLLADGFDVTQATLSRDLDELGAFKVREGRALVYRLPGLSERVDGHGDEEDGARGRSQLPKVLSGLVTSVVSASNQVVIHTPSGAAQYVASIIDAETTDVVLGTIAGDDTVLIILAGRQAADDYAAQLLTVASGQDCPRPSPLED